MNSDDWTPQPWEQLITVLREMGHPHEAAKVAIEKQHLMRKAGKIGKPPQFASPSNFKEHFTRRFAWLRDWLSCQVRNGYHWLSGKVIGYGYDTTRAVVLLFFAAGLFGFFFQYGYKAGYFGPTNAVIQMHYHELCGAPGDFKSSTVPGQPLIHAAKLHWNDSRCTPPEYTSFAPWLYSFDTILPVVSLGQDGDWAPMVVDAQGNDLWLGIVLRWMIIFEILFGWVVTLLLASVMANLIKRD